jgi:chromosome segregation ATPase
MISMAPNLPPATLTDEAMKLCASLLAMAADPGGTKARLDELNAATAAYRSVIDEHAAAKVAADAAAAGLADLQQREQNLADREAALTASQTQLQVASAAIADRDAAVKDREAASDKRTAEIDAKAKALDDRLAAYRQALA